MSIQVSPTVTEIGVSAAAQKRSAYLMQLLNMAQQPAPTLDWLQELRDHAAVRVQEQTFPSTRDEEWRFTDLSSLMAIEFMATDRASVSLPSEAIEPFALPETEQSRLVFVDGSYAPERSSIAQLPDGLVVGNLSSVPESIQPRVKACLGKQSGAEEVFTALNTAGLSDAAVVYVPKNQIVETPIHLLFLSTASETPHLIQPRVLVIAEPNSALTLLEEYGTIGSATYFTNTVTEIWVEENAQINHTRIQRDSESSFHIGKTAVSQARTSRYTGHAISVGAKLSRHHFEIYQTGEQTETRLNGLSMIAHEQVADTHSTIALTKPYGVTNQLHKCIVDDRAHAIFNGKVFVPQAAQMTNAGQLNRNLLLSPKARVDTKPQLEIVADNVKCTHGATVGQLDADEVFYLQSRGIDADSARNLLIYAFAFESLDQIPIASLKQNLCQFVAAHTQKS